MKKNRNVVFLLLIVVISIFLVGCTKEVEDSSDSFPELSYNEELIILYTPIKCNVELEFTVQDLDNNTQSTISRTFKSNKKEQKVLLVQSLVEDSLENENKLIIISATINNVTRFDWLTTIFLIFVFLVLLFYIACVTPVDYKDCSKIQGGKTL